MTKVILIAALALAPFAQAEKAKAPDAASQAKIVLADASDAAFPLAATGVNTEAPRAQTWIWILVAVAVVVTLGIVLANNNRGGSGNTGGGGSGY